MISSHGHTYLNVKTVFSLLVLLIKNHFVACYTTPSMNRSCHSVPQLLAYTFQSNSHGFDGQKLQQHGYKSRSFRELSNHVYKPLEKYPDFGINDIDELALHYLDVPFLKGFFSSENPLTQSVSNFSPSTGSFAKTVSL